MANPIIAENLLTGTSAWQYTNPATTQIQAYADKTSVDAGSNINFFVSTQVGGTGFSINIYRMGYYQGLGARLIQAIAGQVGVAQGYWDAIGRVLNNCPTAITNGATHLLEAGWAASYTYAVPANAVTGVYLAQFVDANSKQTYCVFVVRGNRPADYAYVRPVTTPCAYNDWGGFSLYTNPTVGVQVSFNRPDVNNLGAGGLFSYEVNFIKWAESKGFNLSYLTSIDLHENPSWLLSYKAYLSVGHDEYWTREMRDGVEAAIASGVGAGFLGANHSYWQCRFSPDAGSNADRTITCYKVTTAGANLANDPFYGVDNTRVTSQWRDAVLGRPENSMCGIMFSNVTLNDVDVAWTVDANADTTYFTNTFLVRGNSYGSDLVGYEYDKIFSGSPAGLKTLATTSVTDTNSHADTANTTYYIAASGALVFAAGSIAWTRCLDTYRFNPPAVTFIPEMQQLMTNIMQGLIQAKQPKMFSSLAFHT